MKGMVEPCEKLRKKRKMAETIRINVLVISAESENLTKRRIITLETTFDNTIDQLRL